MRACFTAEHLLFQMQHLLLHEGYGKSALLGCDAELGYK